MTDYADVPAVQALYEEQARVQQALTILDDYAGTVPQYVVAPTIAGAGVPPMVSITTGDPPQSLLSGVRSSLIQRNNQINKELRDLGVTNVPNDTPGGGPPLSEAQPA